MSSKALIFATLMLSGSLVVGGLACSSIDRGFSSDGTVNTSPTNTSGSSCFSSCSGTLQCSVTSTSGGSGSANFPLYSSGGTCRSTAYVSGSGTTTLVLYCGGSASITVPPPSGGGQSSFTGTWTESGGSPKICFDVDSEEVCYDCY